MRPLFAVVVALALAAVGAPGARADSLTDHLGPREISLGDSGRARAVGALATTLNPAGAALNRELVFEGRYGYRPEDSASTIGVSACDSTVPWPTCFYYHYFRADVGDTPMRRRAHETGAAISRALSGRVLVGATVKWFDYNTGTEVEDTRGFTFDAGLLVRITRGLDAAVVGYNLWGEDSDQYPRAVGTGVAVQPLPDLAISADGLWDLDTEDGESTGRYGGGAEYFLRSGDKQTGYPLRLGALYDAGVSGTFVTAGVGLATAKLALDVGLRQQVDGGGETLIIGSLRIWGPRDVAGAL